MSFFDDLEPDEERGRSVRSPEELFRRARRRYRLRRAAPASSVALLSLMLVGVIAAPRLTAPSKQTRVAALGPVHTTSSVPANAITPRTPKPTSPRVTATTAASNVVPPHSTPTRQTTPSTPQPSVPDSTPIESSPVTTPGSVPGTVPPNTAPSPSTTVTSSPPPTPPPSSSTVDETTGGVAHTWSDYTTAGGIAGPTIPAFATVQITCAVQGFRVADGNTWWYRIASAPWDDQYYVSADAFYNNGQTSGPLKGTPFVDPAVPVC